MNHAFFHIFSSGISCAIATVLATSSLTTSAAIAAPLTSDWTYTLDSFNDGTEAQTVGNASTFEVYGMAYRQQGRVLTFALNSNLAVNELYDRPNTALNGSINYGDLILNFSEQSAFRDAAPESLYGIRFDTANDTELELGFYKNVTTQSLSEVNDGHASYSQYNKAVQSLGGTPSLGGLELEPYFDPASVPPTHIASGEKISDVRFLEHSELSDLQFEEQGAIGRHTFGFSVDIGELSTEAFIAHLLTECANDGIAFASELAAPIAEIPEEPQSVPEQSQGLMFVFTLLGFGYILRQRRQATSRSR